MTEIMKVTSRQYKTKNSITATYLKEAFTSLDIDKDKVEEFFANLAGLSGMKWTIEITAENPGEDLGIHMYFKAPED